MNRRIASLALTAAVSLTLSGCLIPSSGRTNTNPGLTMTPELINSDETPDTTAELGTRENPFPAGTAFAMGDSWEVTFGPTNTDASDIVLAEYEYNKIPDGDVAVMVPITTTFVGEGTATPEVYLKFLYVTPSGTYSADATDKCGVFPDSIHGAPDLFNGGSTTKNECVTVPADEAAEGV